MPGDQSGVALDVLQELREEEDDPVHPGIAEAAGHVGRGPGPVGQDAQGEDGFGRRSLDANERPEQGHTDDERPKGGGRRPPGRSGFDQAQHDAGHPGRGRDRAGQVEAAAPALGLASTAAPPIRARQRRWGR